MLGKLSAVVGYTLPASATVRCGSVYFDILFTSAAAALAFDAAWLAATARGGTAGTQMSFEGVDMLLVAVVATPSRCNVASLSFIGDAFCDQSEVGYNTAACNWDGGDCCETTCMAGRPYVLQS